MINYNALLDNLFDNIWEKRCPEYTFVRDGIMRNVPNENDAWFKLKRRIAFLLKDKSDGTCDDVRDWLIDNINPNNQKNRQLSNGRFLHNIANVFYGLMHDECNFSNIESNPEGVRNCLLNTPFALIECKKEAGKGALSDKELKNFLERDAALLQMELAILKPNIIVCSGWPINEFVRGMFPQDDLYIQSNNLAYCRRTKTLIILGYHPSYYVASPITLFGGVMEHYRKFLATEYGKDMALKRLENTAFNATACGSSKYVDEGGDDKSMGNVDYSDRDPLFDEAARFIVSQQQVSNSVIQRRFILGYNRTCRLLDQLEAIGIVGPSKEGMRQVLIQDENKLELLL